MISDNNLTLLALLREAIWRRETGRVAAMDAATQGRVLRLAGQHTVAALVADSMVRGGLLTGEDNVMKAMAITARHRKRNRTISKALRAVAALLEGEGIPYLVFKGETVAARYPDPALRTSGDVDFYVPPAHFGRAETLIAERLSVDIDRESDEKHHNFCYGDTLFEMHHSIEVFGLRRHQRAYDSELERAAAAADCPVLGGVRAMPPELELATLTKHLFGHLLTEGVGLRQLCDLAVVCHSVRGQCSPARLARLLRDTGYHGAFLALGAAMTRHLGLAESDFPLPLSTRSAARGETMLREIMRSGNFGRMGRPQREAGIRRSVETLCIFMRHCLLLMPVAPGEVLGLIPWRIGLTIRKVLGR